MSPEAKTFDVILTRRLNAPPARAWEAWSDPELVMRWWGPAGFTSPLCKMDFREGGTTLVCMRSPDGQNFYNTWNYQRIVPHERIEFIVNFSDPTGRTLDPARMGLPPEIPKSVPHLITFSAVDDNQTELSVTEYGYGSQEIMEFSKSGMVECLDKMAAIFA